MSATAQTQSQASKIIGEALNLPEIDRSYIATKLLESLDEPRDEITPGWREEIRRREKSLAEGSSKEISSGEAWKKVNNRFGTSF